MRRTPELAPVFVRVHTRVKNVRPRPERETTHPTTWANFALVFDCETTTDLREDLNFLSWRFCELKAGAYVCQREGVAYRDNLDATSVTLIREFARGKRADVEAGCPEDILVQSRTQFVDGEFWNALRMGAVIVNFNAPFDLSRLALSFPEAKSKNAGWAMVLWNYRGRPDKLKPKLRIKPKDSRAAFIDVAGGDPANRLIYRGRFLDLSVLGWALRNRHLDLNGFLRSFGLKPKMPHEPTGRVTKRELAYGRRDTQRTVELLNAMKREYDGFRLTRLAPESAMSAASITKAFLDEMHVKEPAQKFQIPDRVLGKCMQAYYGGRSEIRTRHAEMPVVVCDTTSEYPSVAALLHLWPLLRAANPKVVDCTREARKLVESVTERTLLNPATWKDLAFFASIKADGDVLPVRAVYRETGDTNIGVNPLTSAEPIWYAGPDLAASKLKTKRAPRIIRAFKLIPEDTQLGMRVTSLGTRTIDPTTDDFFLALIEERKTLPKTDPHYLLLKIIANALYGIFAELNTYHYGKNRAKRLDVFSGERRFDQPALVVERPGRWHFPPAAALITAGGRLMLAMLEHLVERRRGTYLLMDTDSIFFVASEQGGLIPCPGGPHTMADGTPAVRAITWKELDEICEQVNRLNPYDPTRVTDILKIEDCNYDRRGRQHQLYGLAVSAKRYVVYTRRKQQVEIIKPSEHGLGIVFVPDKRKRYKPVECKDQETGYARWIVETWERLLDDHFRKITAPENALVTRGLWFAQFPAMMRVRVTTPNVLMALRQRDPGAGKPYNFALSPILVDPPTECTLVAPFSKRPETWLSQPYTEIHSGETIHLGGEWRGSALVPQMLASVLWRHYLHAEDKSLAPDGKKCGPYTSGLLRRRPIEAMRPLRYIGKEIERRAQEGEDIGVTERRGPVEYQPGQTARTRPADASLILRAKQVIKLFGFRQFMREAGTKSQHAVERFLKGERIHPRTRVRLAHAVEALEHQERTQQQNTTWPLS
jgi:hypothetical protein